MQNSDEGSRDEDPEKSASPPRQDSSESASSSSSNEQPKQPALRKYIETFDQDTLRNTARMMSMEGLSLLDRQSTALWGEANELQAEMQKVWGLTYFCVLQCWGLAALSELRYFSPLIMPIDQFNASAAYSLLKFRAVSVQNVSCLSY
jgi:hypothetical protein